MAGSPSCRRCSTTPGFCRVDMHPIICRIKHLELYGVQSVSWCLTMALSRPFKEYGRALPLSRLSSPGDRWCNNYYVLGSVPDEIVRDESHLWWLLCSPVCSILKDRKLPLRPLPCGRNLGTVSCSRWLAGWSQLCTTEKQNTKRPKRFDDFMFRKL